MQKNAPVWKRRPDIRELNELLKDTLGSHLGIEIDGVGHDYLEATMPVDHRTVQPFGILHGGASVALSETLGSIAAYLVIDTDTRAAVGLEINANHVRSVAGGQVRGRVTPIHIGRRTQVWETRIVDEDDRLVSVSRLTVAVIDRPS